MQFAKMCNLHKLSDKLSTGLSLLSAPMNEFDDHACVAATAAFWGAYIMERGRSVLMNQTGGVLIPDYVCIILDAMFQYEIVHKLLNFFFKRT
jgi:hypothetical protein